MKITNVISLCFSPTGSTRKIVNEIAALLPWPSMELDITDYSAADGEYRLTGSELLLAGMPVYGGRIPALASRRLKNIGGDDSPAVTVAVYGNRDYDDALLELNDQLEGQGFIVAASLAAIAEHNIMPSVAKGRPDERDISFIRSFAEEAAEKIKAAANSEALPPVAVKGKRPYREYNGVPFKPQANDSCVKCGLCAAKCPAGAIAKEAPDKTDEQKCISCMRCIKECPASARSLNRAILNAAEKLFAAKNSARKEPELFI